jgi:hypothetical protein
MEKNQGPSGLYRNRRAYKKLEKSLFELLPFTDPPGSGKRLEKVKAKVRTYWHNRCQYPGGCRKKVLFNKTSDGSVRCSLELHHWHYPSEKRHLSLGRLKECQSNDLENQKRWLIEVAEYNAPEYTTLLCAMHHQGKVHTPFRHSPQFKRKYEKLSSVPVYKL